MNRRDLILQSTGSAMAIALASSTEALAAAADKKAPAAPATAKFGKLAESTQACIATGLACIRHCQTELANGNKVMAECLQSVLELVSVCENLHNLALYESAYTKDFAKLTGKVCADCGKICEKHAHHMQACKDCMEACKACEKECAAA